MNWILPKPGAPCSSVAQGRGGVPGVGGSVMFAELIVHRWTCDYLDHLPR